MKITIESTPKIVTLTDSRTGSVSQVRIWQGVTDKGIPIQAFVRMVTPEFPKDHPDIDKLTAEFETDLCRMAVPGSAALAIPHRMTI